MKPFARLLWFLLLLSLGPVHAQTLYVVDRGGNTTTSATIYSITAGGSVSTYLSGIDGTDDTGVAVDTSGSVYFTDDTANVINKSTSAGSFSTFATGFLPDTLDGIAFGSGGNLYAGNYYGNGVYQVTPGGSVSTFASFGSNATGVAYNPSTGDLFVSDWESDGNIYKITSGGSVSLFRSETSGDLLNGVALDASGNVYVADETTSDIYKIAADGSSQSIFASGLNGPVGLAFDNSGNLYEADRDSGNIYEFDPSGIQTLFASGFGELSFITFSSVPEPGSVVMLVSGLGLLCAVVHRKHV